MLNLKINGKTHKLKTLFSDITIAELRFAYDYLEKQSNELLQFLNGQKEDIKQSVLLDFQINWIAIFSDIPVEMLENVTVQDETDTSISGLFEYVLPFAYFPETHQDVKEFTLNKEKYLLLDGLQTISGAKLLFGNGSFKQFKLASALANNVNEKTSSTVDSLLQICAVLYSEDGSQSSASINKRVKDFEQLDAYTAFSCYFFFALLLNKYNKFFRLYMGRGSLQQIQKTKHLIRVEELKIKLEKYSFGISSRSKYLNSKFLILKTDLA